MKKDIHPTYHENTTIQCACGATFAVGSTRDDIKVEICSNCHPFYTGKQKLVDTAGRVDKFKARLEASKKMKAEKESQAKEKSEKKVVSDSSKSSTGREESRPTGGTGSGGTKEDK